MGVNYRRGIAYPEESTRRTDSDGLLEGLTLHKSTLPRILTQPLSDCHGPSSAWTHPPSIRGSPGLNQVGRF